MAGREEWPEGQQIRVRQRALEVGGTKYEDERMRGSADEWDELTWYLKHATSNARKQLGWLALNAAAR